MQTKWIIACKTRVFGACLAAIMAWAMLTAGSVSNAQTPPANLSPDLQEIVKLAQAHMTDDVIVNYVKNSGKVYNLSGNDILYLNSQGVSQAVMSTLLQTKNAAPAPAPAASYAPAPVSVPPPVYPSVPASTPPETPTFDYFQAHLTPYGQWVGVPGIGTAWIPTEAYSFGWRPYMDAGHWEYTDAGWFWQSDYPWGDIAFHYGRWINNDYTGGRWAWVPAYDWAPSWVAWREGTGGLGWAPLPWGVEFRVGLGLYWHGALVVEGMDFGLGFDAFVFVGPDHFWGGDYRHYAFGPDRARAFYAHSAFHAGYRMEGGHLRAEGLGRDHVSEITHHEVVEHKASEMRRAEESHNIARRTEEHREVVNVHSYPATGPATSRTTPGSFPTTSHGKTPSMGSKPSGSDSNKKSY
jgi:hypothetical protein